MKPGFALSLSFDGISLLQRAAGGWRLVGDVALDAQDLIGDLAGLRDRADALESGDLRCKVIVPNDQIRYISVSTGSFGGEARMAMVRQALVGATPYPVDDLAFDISADGATTHVAAVVRETLVEAEEFAKEHGFNPVSFVAAPGDDPFLGEPFFGISAHAATLPDVDEVEPDGIAVVVIGPVNGSAQKPEPVTESEPESGPVPEPSPAEFSSQRHSVDAEDAVKTAQESDADMAVANLSDSGAPSLDGALSESPPPPAPGTFTSARAKAEEPAPPDSLAEKITDVEPISVTAPTLDIGEPEETETETSQAPPSDASAFQSRRRYSERVEPVAPASPIARIPPAPPPLAPAHVATNTPRLTAVSRPGDEVFVNAAHSDPGQDEAARMTVFGAREHARISGRPRHYGLMLSAALLLFLAAVAAWASMFLDNGVAGLFRATEPKSELAAVPDTPGIGIRADDPAGSGAGVAPVQSSVEPVTQNPDTTADLPAPVDVNIPDLPAPRRIAQPDLPEQPASPELTDTDSAVLDALRQTVPDSDDTAEQTGDQAPNQALNQAQNKALNQAGDLEPEQLASLELPGDIDADSSPAVTAVLNSAPLVPDTPSIIGLDDLYVASIDRTDLSQDAVALPPFASFATDLALGAVSSPVAAGTAFDLDASGLVVASVEGTLNPDGVIVFLGRPPAVPPAIPTRFETQPETEAANPQSAGLRPRLRPADLRESNQRDNLGGLTREELSVLRPKARPQSTQQQESDPAETPTAQAVVVSSLPRARPGNFDAIVHAAIRPTTPANSASSSTPATSSPTISTPASPATSGGAAPQVAAIAPQTVAPRIPSSASVARQATLRNEINLRRVNLIGVYGSPSNRRALVRLPSGRYKKVKVGDTVDGGRVVAIGDSQLRYQKKGRSLTLKIPSS